MSQVPSAKPLVRFPLGVVIFTVIVVVVVISTLLLRLLHFSAVVSTIANLQATITQTPL
jgi:hypothetical protein